MKNILLLAGLSFLLLLNYTALAADLTANVSSIDITLLEMKI
ncbi:MAG: hypothetical protein Q8N05_00015 [Bacteroidota bacterium]|nr:hypothetical protein [Bacteroidota bacterium]